MEQGKYCPIKIRRKKDADDKYFYWLRSRLSPVRNFKKRLPFFKRYRSCRLPVGMYRLTEKCMQICRVILWMLQIVRLKVIKNTSMANM